MLAVLSIDAWLNVSLESVIQPGSVEADIGRADDREILSCCMTGVGSIAIFEIWVTGKSGNVCEGFGCLWTRKVI